MSAVQDACARWIELSDRKALGEALTAKETAFARDHATSCAGCRAEANLWDALASFVDGPNETPRARAPQPTAAIAARRRAPWPWLAGAAALAAAISAALFIAQGRALDAPPEDPARARAAAPPPETTIATKDVTVILAATGGGPIEIDGRAGVVGQKLERGAVLFAREGSACVDIEPAVHACVARGSMLRLTDLSAHRRLELVVGKVAVELDPLPPGHSFGISTRAGSAIAVGTAFSVEVPAGDAAIVTHVLHGAVLVRAEDGAEQRVTAHEKASMRDAKPSPLSLLDEKRDRALLDVPLRDADKAPVPVARTERAKSASELLIAARRAHGDLAAAIAAYRELFERHANSAEAHTALVPWGELQLARLSEPAGALASFDRYLVRGGPLEEEASFGRIRALRGLGRTTDERVAIDAFVLRFPEGSLTSSLRERLRSMKDP